VIRQIVVSRDAETDLILIWVYYAESSEGAARRIRDEITSKFNLLLQFPHIGRSREDLQHGYRSIPVGNHVVFYREIENGVEIMRVLHGAQDLHEVFVAEHDAE
jgi:toxin ParE1/3/4